MTYIVRFEDVHFRHLPDASYEDIISAVKSIFNTAKANPEFMKLLDKGASGQNRIAYIHHHAENKLNVVLGIIRMEDRCVVHPVDLSELYEPDIKLVIDELSKGTFA